MLQQSALSDYLQSTEILDWQHPEVLKQARQLTSGTTTETAKRCFEFVRDEIRHSHDFRLNPVTCRASDVLKHKTGYCYAKSHLLAALLRANNIPAGLCYQRLSLGAKAGETSRYCLHGLNAVLLPDTGWYRIDARGNKPGVKAQFVPPLEQLAWGIVEPGEEDLIGIFANPLPEVLAALQTYATYDQLAEHLPDIQSQTLR